MRHPKRAAVVGSIYSELSYNTEESIGFLLGRCLTRVTDEIEQSMAELGVRSQQFGVLHAIFKGEAKTPGDLARLRFQNSAAIAYTLDVLEARQLLTRTRSLQDRRGVELELTPEGRALTRLCIPRVVDAQNRVLQGLDLLEYATLSALLSRIAKQT